MKKPEEIWRQRRLEAEALVEEAESAERDVADTDDLDQKTTMLTLANNCRLRALCLLDPMTRPVPEGQSKDDD